MTLRERVLTEWRGLPQQSPRPDRTRRVGEVLPEVLKRLGLEHRLQEAEVIGAWRSIVGDFLAHHSVPDRLRDGVLYVRVLQPAVHYELDRFWKPQILSKLKARFGAQRVRNVKFHIG